jgi:outer membrane protein
VREALKRRVRALWVAVWVGALPHAAQAEVVTLRELERKALQDHLLSAKHQARLSGADADIGRAAAAYYPQVGARLESTAQPGRFFVEVCRKGAPVNSQNECASDDSYLVSGTRTIDQDQAFRPLFRQGIDITASGRLYDFGRTRAAVEAGKLSRAAVVAERAADEENLVLTVRNAYLNWLSAYELARVTEAAALDAQTRRDRVAALIEQGVRPRAELAMVQSDALLTSLELARARADLDSARLALEEAVGAALPADAEPDLTLLDTGRDLPEAGPSALERMLERQRAAARAMERAYRKDRLPHFGVALAAGLRVQGENVFPLYSGAIYLSLPLWDGGLTKATVASARAEADALDAELKLQLTQKEQAHRRASQEATHALASLSIAEELAQLAEKRLADAQAGYEAGVNGIEAIAEARALSRRAQTEVLLSKVSHARARLRFEPVHTAEPSADAQGGAPND